jgi:hypothetical protein
MVRSDTDSRRPSTAEPQSTVTGELARAPTSVDRSSKLKDRVELRTDFSDVRPNVDVCGSR